MQCSKLNNNLIYPETQLVLISVLTSSERPFLLLRSLSQALCEGSALTPHSKHWLFSEPRGYDFTFYFGCPHYIILRLQRKTERCSSVSSAPAALSSLSNSTSVCWPSHQLVSPCCLLALRRADESSGGCEANEVGPGAWVQLAWHRELPVRAV